VAGEFLAAEAAGHDDGGITGDGSSGEPLAWYGDSAYGSAELREAISQAGHQAVIKPRPVQRPVEGGFACDGRCPSVPDAHEPGLGQGVKHVPDGARFQSLELG
jgi:hypothetical protein